MQIEIDTGRTYMVHIVIGFLVLVYLSIFCSHRVSPCTYIVHYPRQFITLRRIHERLEFKAGGVVPLAFALAAVQMGTVRIARQLGHDHLDRIRLHIPDERIVILRNRCQRKQ